jgi:hypothetical protein
MGASGVKIPHVHSTTEFFSRHSTGGGIFQGECVICDTEIQDPNIRDSVMYFYGVF